MSRLYAYAQIQRIEALSEKIKDIAVIRKKTTLGRWNSITGNFFWLWFPAFFQMLVWTHKSSAVLLSSQPHLLFCSTIWEKPLTHLMNTCHTLTLRRPENPARLWQWQSDRGSERPVFTSSHNMLQAVWLHTYAQQLLMSAQGFVSPEKWKNT